jgi:hypothetical protein
LDGSCKQATQQLAGSCSSVQAVAQQLDKHTQDVGSRVQQQAKVSKASSSAAVSATNALKSVRCASVR